MIDSDLKNHEHNIVVIIPAFNEEKSIGKVIEEIPAGVVNEVVVINNASTDQTAAVARAAGATVILEPSKGYGNACLRGIQYCKQLTTHPDIIVFLDGDHSDLPEEMLYLVAPIAEDRADLVIGSRTLGKKEAGSITQQQRMGNWIATFLMRIFFAASFTDLGPFRAIRFTSLLKLNMEDKTYGWTVEMQIKALKMKLRCIELPVSYRKRIGTSKISGTIKGSVMAGYKILYTIFRYL